MTLDEAIKHCEEVAEEKEDFDKFQCGYCKPGCEDGVWKDTCRLPSNVPTGCSWGECSEQNCPLFPVYLECASEHRQLAEWLRELKAVREAWSQLVETVVEIKDNAVDDKDSDSNARDMARFFYNYLRVLEEGIMKEVEGCRTAVGALSRD